MRSLSGFLCPYQSFFVSFFYYSGIPVSLCSACIQALGLKPLLCKTLFLCKTLRKVIE